MNSDSDVAKRERESGNKSVLRSTEKTSVATTRLVSSLGHGWQVSLQLH